MQNELEASADAPARRPSAIPIFFILYLLAGGMLLYIAAGYGRSDLSSVLRAVLGLIGVVFLLACAGLLLRAAWARPMCLAIHGVALLGVVVYGIISWPEDDDGVTRQIVRILTAGGFQIGCLGVWVRADVVKWFEAGVPSDTFTPAK